MRLTITDFTRGLWLVGGKETAVKGWMRRLRGAHELRTPSLRSRNGSLELATTNAVVAIAQPLSGFYYYATDDGTDITLYRSGTSIYSGTGASPLTRRFFVTTDQSGVNEWLYFMTGSGGKKIQSGTTTVYRWGIAAPAAAPTLADGGAGAMAAGTYRYFVVFVNGNTGARSNPNLNAATITQAVNRQVSLTNIPVSGDTQVTQREIYRTVANGARYFRVAVIANNTATTMTDNTVDANLSSVEVQFDNIDPNDFGINTAWKTNDRRVWWTSGIYPYYGNAFYSPPGRPESVRGFIVVGGLQGEPLITGFAWGGANWVFSSQRLYRIFGDDEPFVSFPIDGVPGLVDAGALAVTPYGVAFISYNGVYMFDGARAQLLGFDEVSPIFSGEVVENIEDTLGFEISLIGGQLCYSNEQLFLYGLNGDFPCLVYNFRTQSWRDLGLNVLALTKSPASRQLLASFNNNVYDLENPAYFEDGTTPITIEWEVACGLSAVAHYGTVQRVYLDIKTSGETVTVNLVVDEAVIILGAAITSTRQLVEFPVSSSWQARVFSVRLTGAVSARVELFGVSVDVKLEGANADQGVG